MPSRSSASDVGFFQRIRQLGVQGYGLLGASIVLVVLAVLLILGVTRAVAALREPPPALLPQELPYHKAMPGTAPDETEAARKRFQRHFARRLTFSGYKAQATWDAVWASCPESDCSIPSAAGARLLLPHTSNPAFFEKQFCDYGLLPAERSQLGAAALQLGETGCRISDYEGYRQNVLAAAEARRDSKMPHLIWTSVALAAVLLLLVLVWRKLLDQLSKL